MSHYVSGIFRDALINNSFNLPYIITTPLLPAVQNNRLQRNEAVVCPTEGLEWRPMRTWGEKSS